MLLPFYAALAVVSVFYLALPLVGAILVRRQWRRFRSRAEELRSAPILRYRDVAGGGDRGLGRFRLYGSVEALEGRDRLWLRGEGVSALVDLSRSPLYVLEPGSGEPGSVSRTPWRSVTSLAEGTRMQAAGYLVLEGGKPVFVEAPGESLLAVSYDCEESELVSRLVSGGRAANEYWTALSQLSFALGIVATSAVLVLSWRQIRFPTVRAMTFLAGMLPVLPFIPPGLFFFLLYRLLWRKALAYRVSRDLGRMPRDAAAAGLGPSAEAGDPGAAAARRATVAAAGAGLSVGLAALLNYAIGILLWRRLF